MKHDETRERGNKEEKGRRKPPWPTGFHTLVIWETAQDITIIYHNIMIYHIKQYI